MRRIIIIFFILLVFFMAVTPAGAQQAPQVSARAAILMDTATGRILYSKNAHEPLPMASTTKIMTAILALESGRLNEKVKASEYAAGVEGSSIDLETNEEIILEDLVYGLLLRSGNDAAMAIAEHLAGSEEKFARKMTLRAKELGALQTNFMNPHGLHHEEHYSTAYDMAIIASYAMNMPEFRKITTTKVKKIPWEGREYSRLLRNQNKLLDLYDGAEGVKTGWTTPAGRCFVGSARREGWGLVSTVLNAPQMWEDTIEILDYGYSRYTWETVIERDQDVMTIPVKRGIKDRITLEAGVELGIPLKGDELEYLRFVFSVPKYITAPVQAGQEAGSLQVFFGEEQVGEVPLLAKEAAAKKNMISIIKSWFLGAMTAHNEVPA